MTMTMPGMSRGIPQDITAHTYLAKEGVGSEGAYPSYGGPDIRAVVHGYTTEGNLVQRYVGNLSGITVTAVCETNPRYVLGERDFASVTRGKRAVSGTLEFSVFNADPLIADIFTTEVKGLQDYYKDILDAVKTGGTGYIQNVLGSDPANGQLKNLTDRMEASLRALNVMQDIVGKSTIRYADQLRPFDVTITFVNDQGYSSLAAVRQIYIVSQGIGWTVDDLQNSQVYSYIARYYEPMRPMQNKLPLQTGDTTNASTAFESVIPSR